VFNLISPIPIYIELYTDKVEAIRLDTGASISRVASDKFSNPRLVVASFYNAEQLIRSVLKELLSIKSLLQPPLNIVIQQMEKLEGGLSDIERRALIDLGEQIGGRYIKVFEAAGELTHAQALLESKK
jgi:hypothetical protein